MMTNPFSSLIAQSEQKPGRLTGVDLKEVSKHVTDGLEHDLPWELLLVGIGATLTAIVVISFRRWWQGRHDDPSPTVLYSAIARKAGLGWRDRFLLWRIASSFNLPTPITLMLARGTLRHYSRLYLSNRSGYTSQRTGLRLARIEATLFG